MKGPRWASADLRRARRVMIYTLSNVGHGMGRRFDRGFRSGAGACFCFDQARRDASGRKDVDALKNAAAAGRHA